ncbi:hypothetical protein D1871_04955 [Nakamurella silvestris]|nr:hypothetical protein D1871_04955 [Nakamurella silvestris]
MARGLYYKGAPTRYGMVRPSPESVALEIAGPAGVGPAGVSAARALGLTTQLPVRPELAVVGRLPKGVHDVHLVSRANKLRMGLSYLEIAVLETLRSWRSTVEGGWSAFVTAVKDLVKVGRVRLDNVHAAAGKEHNTALAESLTRLFDALPAAGATA